MRTKNLHRVSLDELARAVTLAGIAEAEAERIAKDVIAESLRRKEKRERKRALRTRTCAIENVRNVANARPADPDLPSHVGAGLDDYDFKGHKFSWQEKE